MNNTMFYVFLPIIVLVSFLSYLVPLIIKKKEEPFSYLSYYKNEIITKNKSSYHYLSIVFIILEMIVPFILTYNLILSAQILSSHYMAYLIILSILIFSCFLIDKLTYFLSLFFAKKILILYFVEAFLLIIISSMPIFLLIFNSSIFSLTTAQLYVFVFLFAILLIIVLLLSFNINLTKSFKMEKDQNGNLIRPKFNVLFFNEWSFSFILSTYSLILFILSFLWL